MAQQDRWPPTADYLRSGYSSVSFVWGIRVRVRVRVVVSFRVGVRVRVRVGVRVRVRVRVRVTVGVRVGVGVRIRVISLRDSFSVLLRPQHLSMLTTHGRKYTFWCDPY